MLFYKIYYSILYLVYKGLRGQSKKNGSLMYKSYITNSIRLISVTFTLTLLVSLRLLRIKNCSTEAIFLTSIVAGFVLILLLNLTLSKKKFFKYRFIFLKSDKYAYLYIVFSFALIVLSFIFSMLLN